MRLALAIIVLLLALPGAAGARSGVPAFAHVVVIVFENKEQDRIIGDSNAPTFNRMASQYAALDDYHGLTHPSLPNYLAMISGSTLGVTKTCTDCAFRARTLAGTLEAAKHTWKTYAEDLPRAGYTRASAGRYAKKHVPFLYFREVTSRRARLNRVVPLSALQKDLRKKTLPAFSLVVPNLCNSMHDCSVETGDSWLAKQLPPLLRLPKTVVFVIFDEGTTNDRGGGHVAAMALGTAVQPGSTYGAVTSHCGLLRTIEDAWSLPLLGCSAKAAPITGIYR